MVAAAQPRVVVCMPCGYDAERAAEEARAHADSLRTVGAERSVAVDAAAYFSRPGPRLVDGLELLANILHPELVPDIAPPGLIIDLEV
jgi:iron complex transport system substrate-binding protein